MNRILQERTSHYSQKQGPGEDREARHQELDDRKERAEGLKQRTSIDDDLLEEALPNLLLEQPFQGQEPMT